MSEFGLKIKNIEAGSLYGYNLGIRDNYEFKQAMFTNSLFSDFIRTNGLEDYKGESTKDIICLEFNYGTRSYEEEKKHLEKLIKDTQKNKDKQYSVTEQENRITKFNELLQKAEANKDKFDKKSADEIRVIYYTQGTDVTYTTKDKKGNILKQEIIHYKMLYRTAGKAKKGSCMFIREELYDIAHDFLYMGLTLPYENAPIVEMGAYSSLITSTTVGNIKINPENILVLKDVDSFFETQVVSIETNENKHCIAKTIDKYKLKNTLFDGQALIENSLCPEWTEGYLLLRHHLTKMAAFCTHIQKFFQDWFGDEYETAQVEDMWGNKHYAKDIELITTDNGVKWLKLDATYEYWCKKVHENGDMFGIVKTAHQSKLGNMQRMSYQMINALNLNTMEQVVANSVDYIGQLKSDDKVLLQYLKDNSNFSNDYDVLIALVEQDPDFIRSEYFRERKYQIIKEYVLNFKNGKVIQEGDNLVVIGSPYAMLLHAVGEDVEKDPTFTIEEDAIQCYTERFADGEYLAEFRNPFNSQNGLGHMHNVYHEFFKKYFNFGKQIIAVNMIHTVAQDRNNGLTNWPSLGETLF